MICRIASFISVNTCPLSSVCVADTSSLLPSPCRSRQGLSSCPVCCDIIASFPCGSPQGLLCPAVLPLVSPPLRPQRGIASKTSPLHNHYSFFSSSSGFFIPNNSKYTPSAVHFSIAFFKSSGLVMFCSKIFLRSSRVLYLHLFKALR